MTKAVTRQEMRDMIRRMLDIVKNGKDKDAAIAFSIIRDTIFGRPKESVEVSMSDQQATPLSQYSQAQLDQLEAILTHPDDAEVIVLEDKNTTTSLQDKKEPTGS